MLNNCREKLYDQMRGTHSKVGLGDENTTVSNPNFRLYCIEIRLNCLNNSANLLYRDGRASSTFHTDKIWRCIHSILFKICRKKAIVVVDHFGCLLCFFLYTPRAIQITRKMAAIIRRGSICMYWASSSCQNDVKGYLRVFPWRATKADESSLY